MTHLEELTNICKDQGRGLFTSYYNGFTSVIVTQPSTYEVIEIEREGKGSVEEYAGLMLDLLEPKLRIVK